MARQVVTVEVRLAHCTSAVCLSRARQPCVSRAPASLKPASNIGAVALMAPLHVLRVSASFWMTAPS